MSENSFSGNLPASLFALPHLKILDLSDNEFSGGIPGSLFSGPISLEVLDLSGNILNGTLPVRGKKKYVQKRDFMFTSVSATCNNYTTCMHGSF